MSMQERIEDSIQADLHRTLAGALAHAHRIARDQHTRTLMIMDAGSGSFHALSPLLRLEDMPGYVYVATVDWRELLFPPPPERTAQQEEAARDALRDAEPPSCARIAFTRTEPVNPFAPYGDLLAAISEASKNVKALPHDDAVAVEWRLKLVRSAARELLRQCDALLAQAEEERDE